MAKPTGSTCNLDCSYCFYLHKEELLHQDRHTGMSDEVLENFIRQYIDGGTATGGLFRQGGEPTLMGLEFFQKVVKFQKLYQKPGQRVENDLQTNGVLLNDKWAEFLKEHQFLVGLSIDGPRELHDRYRVTRSGKPTFDKVMAGVEALKRHGVPFNAPVTVNRTNAAFRWKYTASSPVNWAQPTYSLTRASNRSISKQTAPQFWQDESIPLTGSRRAPPAISIRSSPTGQLTRRTGAHF